MPDDAKATTKATISAKVIRADGTVEDLGVIATTTDADDDECVEDEEAEVT